MDSPLGFVEEIKKPGDKRSNVLNTDQGFVIVQGNLSNGLKSCISGEVILESVIVDDEDFADLSWLELRMAN